MSCDVLIIEDDEMIADIVSINLNCAGMTTLLAENGKKGLDAAKSDAPSVILLDVRLPDMDGWEVSRRIKEAKTGPATPAVIFLTAATQSQDREKGRIAGGDGYIAKPFDVENLVSTVKKFLHRP